MKLIIILGNASELTLGQGPKSAEVDAQGYRPLSW
jgi:hypothetical protein